MGKLRILSGAEVIRILERHGFAQIRQRGSHCILQKKTDGSTITVPVPLHDVVRRGTLMSIIRQSGVARSHFENE